MNHKQFYPSIFPGAFLALVPLVILLLMGCFDNLTEIHDEVMTTQPIIAFTRTESSYAAIYIMNADGSNLKRLTSAGNSYNDDGPSWTPDGAHILFGSDRTGNYDIYIMDADGNNQIQLTSNPEDERFPTMSPNSAHIAFARYQSGFEIYTMYANGTNLSRLTNNAYSDSYPTWSPDGTRIAFTSGNLTADLEVYNMNPYGTILARLTNNSVADWLPPSWSPDGTRLAFTRTVGSYNQIIIIDLVGTNERQITFTSANNWHPSWSSDGDRIVFSSDRDGGDEEIYIMNSDGSNPVRLTYHTGMDNNPTWSPF